MCNVRQLYTITSAAEQRVLTNWRQHSPEVDTVPCNKTDNVAIAVKTVINKHGGPTGKFIQQWQ